MFVSLKSAVLNLKIHLFPTIIWRNIIQAAFLKAFVLINLCALFQRVNRNIKHET